MSTCKYMAFLDIVVGYVIPGLVIVMLSMLLALIGAKLVDNLCKMRASDRQWWIVIACIATGLAIAYCVIDLLPCS